MDIDAAKNAIRQYYQDNVVNGVQPVAFPTEFDNQPLTDSTGNPIDKPTESPWVRFALHINDGQQVEIAGVGANTHRHPGTAISQIFVPVDKGDVDAWLIAKFISAAFRGKTVGGSVRFGTPIPRPVGRDGAYWQMNVICPFHFDLIG